MWLLWQELAAADDGDGRNWLGIVISILVILFIFGLIIIAIVIVSPSQLLLQACRSVGYTFADDADMLLILL